MFLNRRKSTRIPGRDNDVYLKSTPLFVEIFTFQVAEVGFPRTLDVLFPIQCLVTIPRRTVPDFEAFSAFPVKKIHNNTVGFSVCLLVNRPLLKTDEHF